MKGKKDKLVSSFEFARLVSKLRTDLESIVSRSGLDLYDLSFVPENNITYFRVTICHPDRNISLDDCEITSKEIEKFLDKKNLIPFSYTLEVQSKGTEPGVKNVSEYSFTLSKLGLVVKS